MSEVGAGVSSGSAVGRRSGQVMPLKSKHLTVTLLRKLAGGLGVPTTVSLEYLESHMVTAAKAALA